MANMTNIEYEQAFDDIFSGKPITQHTADQLTIVAWEAKDQFKKLRKSNPAAAYWFKDERARIREALSMATILAVETATE